MATVNQETLRLQTERRRREMRQAALRLVLVLLAVIYALFPVLWIVSASLNPVDSLTSSSIIPRNASLDNYKALLDSDIHPFGTWIMNSVAISLVAMVLSVLVATFAAYAFSRFRFKGREVTLLLVFLVQVFPSALTIIATFLLIQEIGNYYSSFGLNSYGGIILVYLGGAMGINTWLLKGFFDSIPRDLDESAMIDGASHWVTFWLVLFPLVRPILAVVGILTFIFTYSDYIIALTLLKQTEYQTLAVGLNLFIADQFSQQWGIFAAGALLGAIPVVVLYLLMQDYIVGGLTAGAVKG